MLVSPLERPLELQGLFRGSPVCLRVSPGCLQTATSAPATPGAAQPGVAVWSKIDMGQGHAKGGTARHVENRKSPILLYTAFTSPYQIRRTVLAQSMDIAKSPILSVQSRSPATTAARNLASRFSGGSVRLQKNKNVHGFLTRIEGTPQRRPTSTSGSNLMNVVVCRRKS